MIKLLFLWIYSSFGCSYNVKLVKMLVGIYIVYMVKIVSWVVVVSWWLVGEKSYFFLRLWFVIGYLCFSGWFVIV